MHKGQSVMLDLSLLLFSVKSENVWSHKYVEPKEKKSGQTRTVGTFGSNFREYHHIQQA